MTRLEPNLTLDFVPLEVASRKFELGKSWRNGKVIRKEQIGYSVILCTSKLFFGKLVKYNQTFEKNTFIASYAFLVISCDFEIVLIFLFLNRSMFMAY